MLTASWFLKKNLPIGTRGSFAPLVFSIGVCLATFGVGISASAQSPVLDDRRHDTHGQQFRPGGSVHVDVDLALVNVSVTDAHDRPVTFLGRDSFRIFEDNIEQEVVNFSSEDVPVSIGVIFDLSGSMAKNLSYAKEAAEVLGHAAELFSPFTSNIEELQNR